MGRVYSGSFKPLGKDLGDVRSTGLIGDYIYTRRNRVALSSREGEYIE